MSYASKIVLHSVSGVIQNLQVLVEDFLKDGVKYVGIVGIDAARIEDLIDEAVVGEGSDSTRFLLTASHDEGESLQDALQFALNLSNEYGSETQIVEI